MKMLILQAKTKVVMRYIDSMVSILPYLGFAGSNHQFSHLKNWNQINDSLCNQVTLNQDGVHLNLLDIFLTSSLDFWVKLESTSIVVVELVPWKQSIIGGICLEALSCCLFLEPYSSLPAQDSLGPLESFPLPLPLQKHSDKRHSQTHRCILLLRNSIQTSTWGNSYLHFQKGKFKSNLKNSTRVLTFCP